MTKKVFSIQLENSVIERLDRVKGKFGWNRNQTIGMLLKTALPHFEKLNNIEDIINEKIGQ